MSEKMFDYDGPVVRATNKAIGLICLNLLTIICMIPVITLGASLAAMNSVVLKLARDEENYVAKDFFKAFKANFKLGVPVSIAIVLIVGLGLADLYAISLLDVWFADVAKVLLIVFGIFFAITMTFLFPIMAKFEAGFKDTVKNSFKFAVSHIWQTVVLFLINIFPWVLVYFLNFMAPILFLFGLSVPAYIGTSLYNKIFLKMEEEYYAGKDI